MPIFEYRCTICSTEIEKLAKHSEASPLCAVCNIQMHRLIGLTSPPKFVGTGYYETDFKAK